MQMPKDPPPPPHKEVSSIVQGQNSSVDYIY